MSAGAGRAQDPRCEARDIDAQPARAAGGTRQQAVFGALPAVGRQGSGRRRSSGGVAAVVEGDGLLRVRAPHQQPQRQGYERDAALHAAPHGVACISASTSASTRIGLASVVHASARESSRSPCNENHESLNRGEWPGSMGRLRRISGSNGSSRRYWPELLQRPRREGHCGLEEKISCSRRRPNDRNGEQGATSEVGRWPALMRFD